MENLKTKTGRAQKILEFVLKEIQSDDKRGKSHDINHILRVWEGGMCIGRNEKANIEVLEPALLLHDIKRPYSEKEEKYHSILSADFAASILKDFGYSSSEIGEICDAIRTHSRSSLTETPKTIEAKIVYDSDKLDYLGEKGIERVVDFGKNHKWGNIQIAEWYLRRILDIVKNQPFFTKNGAELAKINLNISIKWCEKNLPNKKFREIIQKFGFSNATEIILKESSS
jgi:HD superfamily phosphodiesterase